MLLTALFVLLPAMATANFADFVGLTKDASKLPTEDANPVVDRQTVTFSQHMGTFWDRNSPSDFIGEYVALAFLALIVGLFFWGKAQNENIAKTKFQAIYRQLHENFSQVGLAPNTAPLSKDGPDLYVSYVTGRKNVQYAHVSLYLLPRQDLCISYPLRGLYGLYFDQESLVDRLTIEFTLPAEFEGFVFGLVHKNVMRYQRSANWGLTFTKTNDAPFSNYFVIMSEVAEVTEKVLTQDLISVATNMNDSLEYMVLSDQPTKQPKSADQSKSTRTLKFSVLLGQPSATRENLNSLLASVLNLIDALPTQARKLSVNAQKKLTIARDDVYQAISKQIIAEEAEDLPKRLTRKEIRDKEKRESIGKLSAKDQKRALEKERERALKRGQSKMSKRG